MPIPRSTPFGWNPAWQPEQKPLRSYKSKEEMLARLAEIERQETDKATLPEGMGIHPEQDLYQDWSWKNEGANLQRQLRGQAPVGMRYIPEDYYGGYGRRGGGTAAAAPESSAPEGQTMPRGDGGAIAALRATKPWYWEDPYTVASADEELAQIQEQTKQARLKTGGMDPVQALQDEIRRQKGLATTGVEIEEELGPRKVETARTAAMGAEDIAQGVERSKLGFEADPATAALREQAQGPRLRYQQAEFEAPAAAGLRAHEIALKQAPGMTQIDLENRRIQGRKDVAQITGELRAKGLSNEQMIAELGRRLQFEMDPSMVDSLRQEMRAIREESAMTGEGAAAPEGPVAPKTRDDRIDEFLEGIQTEQELEAAMTEAGVPDKTKADMRARFLARPM